MSNHIYLIAGAAFLLAGTVHGEATDTQAIQESRTAEQIVTLEPPASIATMETTDKLRAENTPQEQHTTAKPVYLNGGYFGDLGE